MTRALTPGRIAIVALAVVVLAVPALLRLDGPAETVEAAGLTRQDDDFTVLSIEQFDTLAETVTPAGRVRFDALVSNMAGNTARYEWTLVVGPGGDQRVRRQGSVVVDSGETIQLPMRTRIRDCSRRVRVEVRMSTTEQRPTSVGFWVAPDTAPVAGNPSCAA